MSLTEEVTTLINDAMKLESHALDSGSMTTADGLVALFGISTALREAIILVATRVDALELT